jgi:hypothetical protein
MAFNLGALQMKNAFSVLRSRAVKFGTAATVLASAGAANADTAAAIAAAESAGISQVTLAIGAVVAICALVMGLNIVIGLLKR